MLKNIPKPYNRAQVLWEGEGSAEVQPKAQVCPVFFMKPSLIKKVENLVIMSQIVCIGGLSPSIMCSQIQKCLKLKGGGRGAAFFK